MSDNSHVEKTCRNCLDTFYSVHKYEDHSYYYKNRSSKKLITTHKKYLEFENLKNFCLNDFVIVSDFECIIDKDTNQHKFMSGGFYLKCRNEKYSKMVQNFYDINDYCKSLKETSKYIENVENKYLKNDIDYDSFDQEEFDNTKSCKFCKSNFDHEYKDRIVILEEICDKEKLKYILDNNDIDEEVNNLTRNYYNSLDNLGRKKVIYRQRTNSKNRYHAVGSALTYLKKEIRNPIIPKNVKDIDMVNCHPVILLYLCEKHGLGCNILKDYVGNRDEILLKFGDNRKEVKETFLTVLNGGFKKIYNEGGDINSYLKNFEKEIVEIQNYFFENDKRFSDTTVYNYKGKNLSRIILDLENQILQIMINYFNMKQVNLLTLEYYGLKIYSNKKSKHYSINELENLIFEKSGIKMKLSFKVMEDFYLDFGIRCNTDDIIQKNIIENKSKVIHHDHALEKNNIL